MKRIQKSSPKYTPTSITSWVFLIQKFKRLQNLKLFGCSDTSGKCTPHHKDGLQSKCRPSKIIVPNYLQAMRLRYVCQLILIVNLTRLSYSWRSDWIVRTLTSSMSQPIDEFTAEWAIRRWGLGGARGSRGAVLRSLPGPWPLLLWFLPSTCFPYTLTGAPFLHQALLPSHLTWNQLIMD